MYISAKAEQLATEHAAQLATRPATEADYEYISRFLFAYSWSAAEAIYGASLVRAAMIPTE